MERWFGGTSALWSSGMMTFVGDAASDAGLDSQRILRDLGNDPTLADPDSPCSDALRGVTSRGCIHPAADPMKSTPARMAARCRRIRKCASRPRPAVVINWAPGHDATTFSLVTYGVSGSSGS